VKMRCHNPGLISMRKERGKIIPTSRGWNAE